MTGRTRVTMHWGTAALMSGGLLLAGAGASQLLMGDRTGGGSPAVAPALGPGDAVALGTGPTPTKPRGMEDPLPDVVVPLGPDAVRRAGIAMATVVRGGASGGIRLPGVVEPNAYRQVAVTPLVAGRVTHVSAELGDRVSRGETIARIYSPELAEMQTKYVSARAMLDAHERDLQRTRRLADIGAASRRELERVDAEHAAQVAAVQSARSRLELLGVAASALDALADGAAVDATARVPAPADGVVIERGANVGLNVDPRMTLFTVADLSSVWVVADVFERDFPHVRPGAEARISTPAYPQLEIRGRINYVDPRVSAGTRTSRVRIEVANPGEALRLGMYVDVNVTPGTDASTPVVPRRAIQQVGGRTVVYLVDRRRPGAFIEREVRLGPGSGDRVQVLRGVEPGDEVVAEGSFFVRAERERLGLRPDAEGSGPGSSGALRRPANGDDVQTVTVLVTEQGYEPATIPLRAGTPARITVTRTTDNTCGTEIVMPALRLTRSLPLHEPVVIEFTPEKPGEMRFACGMGMLTGKVVVE